MTTRIATSAIPEAVALLRAGNLVAFPTETVYGLGADARNPTAIQKIYAAKDRPSTNPLIVHVASAAHAREYVTTWPALATQLTQKFWPGPLTLVLQRGSTISPLVSAGRDTVALRSPNHPMAQALLQEFASPIAAPSANRSGFTSPTSAQHVHAELAGRIPLILDGGPCTIGLESTVLDLSHAIPTILRHGAITREMLQSLIGPVAVTTTSVAPHESAPSPGMLEKHYAPRAPAYRFPRTLWSQTQSWLSRQASPIILLSHDPTITISLPHQTILLPNNAPDYACILYAALREADEKHPSSILILSPDEQDGLWTAITDRLHRATIPLGESK